MSSLIIPELVTLDADLGPDKEAVIRHLASTVVDAGRADDLEGLYGDAWARESKTATGVPGGIAIPHCKSAHVTTPSLAMARLPQGIDWGANDGPADLVFFIAASEGADSSHLKLLSKLARSLIKKDFTQALREAKTQQDVVDLVDGALSDEPAAAAGAASAATGAGASASSVPKSLVAVTACPTGIAHTYMAADSLKAAADEMGVPLQVETQGSAGATPLPDDVIKNAAAVIFAVEVDVRDKQRFAGKPVVQGPVKRGIDEPKKMIDEALAAADNPNARRVGGAADASSSSSADSGGESFGAKTKKVLLTGVSYMIPFVAAGGLLTALGFAFGGYDIVLPGGNPLSAQLLENNSLWNLPGDIATESPHLFGGLGLYIGAVLVTIGGISMGFLVPALAGYIAYGMADRPGIAPGFVAGSVALTMDAGFIGGLVGGVIAGAVAYWISRLQVPRWLRGLMPVVIIPLIASLVSGGLLITLLGGPIAALTQSLENVLSGMSGAAAVALGAILGLMMAFDLGGPVNKVAYAFAVAGLGAGTATNVAPFEIMAAVMAAGMVPPLALALATLVDKRSYTLSERENGKAAWLLGASFISEGAIPFAAADPLRVIPACMLGSAVTGAMIMGMGVESRAPHGGFFVWFAMNNVFLFALAVLVGMVISAAALVVLKRYVGKKKPEAVAQAQEPALATV